MADTQPSQPGQWWDEFPAPKAKCPEVTADEVMKMFDDMDIKPDLRQFLLVDVRRNDWEARFLHFELNYIFCYSYVLISSGWNYQNVTQPSCSELLSVSKDIVRSL